MQTGIKINDLVFTEFFAKMDLQGKTIDPPKQGRKGAVPWRMAMKARKNPIGGNGTGRDLLLRLEFEADPSNNRAVV